MEEQIKQEEIQPTLVEEIIAIANSDLDEETIHNMIFLKALQLGGYHSQQVAVEQLNRVAKAIRELETKLNIKADGN